MQPTDVTNIPKLAQYIIENEDKIAIRAKINDKWGSFYLTELPKQKRAIAV